MGTLEALCELLQILQRLVFPSGPPAPCRYTGMDEPLQMPDELQAMADAARARHVQLIRRQVADGSYDDGSEAVLAAVAQRLVGELHAG